jgi:dihydropteroate synthase
VHSIKDASEAIQEIGSDPNSIPIMSPKMVHRVVQIDNVILQDAIIIKQDMLSIGGEVAVPKNTFELHAETATILVSGTIQQYQLLITKLIRHYSRIQRIANELKQLIETIK